ncbi:E3 ubiquitin-protein ligase RNF180-like isoform X1 [Watersipora subatra]|uniref:E3 ubiquitin-protein ligase RNF180-like isoform X1 n=1 Tax=Watersipora subatra TaxID=2589382 RepID=UPI00355C0CB5
MSSKVNFAQSAKAKVSSTKKRVLKGSHQRSVSDVCRSIHKEWWMCAICLELMYRPHRVSPCQHIFCQACLQHLAANHPVRTACPMCRAAITDCLFSEDVAVQIQHRFPLEYKKFSETEEREKLLPGRASRRTLSIFDWLRFTIGNREHRHLERTDRQFWHFCTFIIMITVVICSFYLVHYIILASRYMSDYIPSVPVPNDFKLDNVPLVVIGFIATLILLLR